MSTNRGTLQIFSYKGARYRKLYIKDHSEPIPEFVPMLGGDFTSANVIITPELTVGVEYTIRVDYYFENNIDIVPLASPESSNNTINFIVPPR